MTWSDAARKASAEARRRGAKGRAVVKTGQRVQAKRLKASGGLRKPTQYVNDAEQRQRDARVHGRG